MAHRNTVPLLVLTIICSMARNLLLLATWPAAASHMGKQQHRSHHNTLVVI